jgi:uncharacterized membrane protein SirB2
VCSSLDKCKFDSNVYIKIPFSSRQELSCCSDATLDKSLQIISHVDDDTMMLSGTENNLTKLVRFVVIQQKAKWPRCIKRRYANCI